MPLVQRNENIYILAHMTAGKYFYDIHSHLRKIILQRFAEIWLPSIQLCPSLSSNTHT